MTAGKIDKLVRMANQIGDFYAAMPEQEAKDGVATHLRRFWTPKMMRQLVEFTDHGGRGLNTTAASAVEALRQTVTAA